MKKKLSIPVLSAVILGISSSIFVQGQSIDKSKKALLRVGVYDSRAVAVAYAHSSLFADTLKAQKKELEEAEAKGDQSKIRELRARGRALQQELHLQGFGTAPVHEYLDTIKDKLPEIARQGDVDVIVSKWAIDYVVPEAAMTDITDRLIEPFGPDQRVRNIIRDLENKAPLSKEEILAHEDM